MSGAIIDVVAAYNQVALTREAAILHAVKVRAFCASTGGMIMLAFIYLVTIFGFTRAGNVYCTCAQSIHAQHNADHERSLTYIDDGALIGPARLMDQSRAEYKHCITTLFGPGAVNETKDKFWPTSLEFIGWHLDFVEWNVMPKERGMAKMVLALFEEIAPGQRHTTLKALDRVTGLLTWYSLAIPSGASFVASLFACKHKNEDTQRTHLTALAMADLDWWRALVIVGQTHRHLLAASIDAVRTNPVPHRYMRADASTSIGAGALVSLIEGGVALACLALAPSGGHSASWRFSCPWVCPSTCSSTSPSCIS